MRTYSASAFVPDWASGNAIATDVRVAARRRRPRIATRGCIRPPKTFEPNIPFHSSIDSFVRRQPAACWIGVSLPGVRFRHDPRKAAIFNCGLVPRFRRTSALSRAHHTAAVPCLGRDARRQGGGGCRRPRARVLSVRARADGAAADVATRQVRCDERRGAGRRSRPSRIGIWRSGPSWPTRRHCLVCRWRSTGSSSCLEP